MNQQLIDYTVRNITTGDEEDIRVQELDDSDVNGFPDEVQDEIRSLLASAHDSAAGARSLEARVTWGEVNDQILNLLLPYISDRPLYDQDYPAWENNVLDGLYEGINAEAGLNDKGQLMVGDVLLCGQCGGRPAEFTVDWPDDGLDVCSLCLPGTLREAAEYGHEWPHTFNGQYPRFLKVTPRNR